MHLEHAWLKIQESIEKKRGGESSEALQLALKTYKYKLGPGNEKGINSVLGLFKRNCLTLAKQVFRQECGILMRDGGSRSFATTNTAVGIGVISS